MGNSGGGTLTAYIAALDPRVTVAAICCYITTLRRRMGNRIQEDPSADPEQDIFGFVGEGIDHAGLLALRVPRPTLLGVARFDFFPIEGARESFAEAKRLYEVAGAGDRVAMAEVAARHGLTLPLRNAVYQWFDRWLIGRQDEPPVSEIAVKPRPARELLVCTDGQVNLSLQSRPMLSMVWEEFERKPKPSRTSLRDLLGLDPDQAAPMVTKLAGDAKPGQILIVFINGNESRGWNEETELLKSLESHGHAIVVVNPRGAGQSRPKVFAQAAHYTDPLSGPEENIAYNAFLVGKSLLGMRVADVLKASETLRQTRKPSRVIVCGRRDAALVACLAAAVDPQIDQVACEDMLLSFRLLFAAEGFPINAASILPGLLQKIGDVADLLAQIAPRKVLVGAGIGQAPRLPMNIQINRELFSQQPRLLVDWIGS